MKDCQDRIEDISADLDGELSAEEKAELETHLAQCPECRALRDELTAMQQAFPLTDVAPPDTLTPGILYKTTVETIENPWRRRITALISVAACVALLLWIGQNNNFLSPVEADMSSNGENAVAPGALPDSDGIATDIFDNGSPDEEHHAFSDTASPASADEAPVPNAVDEPAYSARYGVAADTDTPVRYVIVMEEPGVLKPYAFDLSEEMSDGSYIIPLEVFESWIGEGRVRMQNDAVIIDPDSTGVLVMEG